MAGQRVRISHAAVGVHHGIIYLLGITSAHLQATNIVT